MTSSHIIVRVPVASPMIDRDTSPSLTTIWKPGLRAYRDLSKIVYCTYSDLSVLEFMFLMDLSIHSFGLEYRSLEPTSLVQSER